jgi:hypothetical protein
MCTSFEDGVAEFITSLPSSKGQNYSAVHNEEVKYSRKKENKRKRRKVPNVKQPTEEVGDQEDDNSEELKGKNPDEVNVDAGCKLPKSNKRKTMDDYLVGVVATNKKSKVTSTFDGVVASNKTSLLDDQPDANSKDQDVEDEKGTQQVGSDDTLLEEVSDVNHQKHEVPFKAEVSHDCAPNMMSPGKLHALNHLQLYGSGSQSSTDTPPAHNVEVNDGITISAQIPSNNKKSVSFSVEVKDNSKTSYSVPISEQQISRKLNQGSPLVRRPVTRSMSPMKATTATSATPSPRRLTRLAAAAIKANQNKDDDVLDRATPNERIEVTPSELIDSTMNRKLELDFTAADPVPETEMQRKIRELRDDCPSFDLGLDNPGSQQIETEGQVQQPDATMEEPIIISSNEDSGDSLDKIFATIEMPNTTPATVKCKVVHEVHDSPSNPSSCTPVPQPRRIVKPGPTLQSPYENLVNKPTVPKSDAELYNKVCSYGGRTKHPLNEERIIDYGDYYILLRDLANSVKPEGLISNTTCEIALRVLASEMVNQKKYVMPLCIAVSKITCPSSFYTGMFILGDVLTVFVSNLLLFSFMAFFEMQTKLRSATCNLDRTVRKAFQCTPSHRLDHKDFVSPQSITKRLFFCFSSI